MTTTHPPINGCTITEAHVCRLDYLHARSTYGPGKLHSRPAPGPLCPECVAEDAAVIAGPPEPGPFDDDPFTWSGRPLRLW